MEDLTKVTVKFTVIKMFQESSEQIETVKVNGSLNISQCKEFAKNSGYIYISKENVKESFNVNTTQLILLKEDN